MKNFLPSKLYFAIALFVIIALNIFIISRILILQEVIEALSSSVAKIPELSQPLVVPPIGRK